MLLNLLLHPPPPPPPRPHPRTPPPPTPPIHPIRAFQPRHPSRHRRDPLEHEPRERPAVRRQLALALHHVQIEPRLLVRVRGEHLPRARWDRRVPRQDLLDHATHGLQPKRQ